MFLVAGYRRKIGSLAGKLAIEIRQGRFARRVHKKIVYAVEEIVAGGPSDRPGGGKVLLRLEDFLRYDPRARRRFVKTFEILFRIAQPVGMIHPHAVENVL